MSTKQLSDLQKLKKKVYDTAVEMANRGAGYAQEAAVMRALRERLKPDYDLSDQQDILTCWHDLFLDRKLSWGYDLDSPSWPFFHVPDRQGA